MAERTDEQVRKDRTSADTDELLAEVEALTEDSTDRTSEPSPGVTSDGLERKRSTPNEASRSRDRTVASHSRTARVRERAGELFSPRAFLMALVLSSLGLFVGGLIPLLPLGGALGIFAAAFVLGAGSDERKYVEAALAGGIVLGVSSFFHYLRFALFTGAGLAPALLGVGLGLVLGIVGHYFGRDLRGGLTQDL